MFVPPTPTPPDVAETPSDAAVGPSAATPEATIRAFLAFARSPEVSFTVDISGAYVIGSHHIDYAMTGSRSAGDVIEAGSVTVDGTSSAIGSAIVDGRLYGLGAEAWTQIDGPAEASAAYAGVLLSFARALILEDLGRDPVTGLYRLRLSAGVSLFPPQATTDAIPDASDPSERLELLVTSDGLPVEATYTRSLSGTIDGVAGTAAGTVRFAFSGVGGRVSVPEPALAPGVTMPPPLDPTPPPAALEWTVIPLAYASWSIEMPGDPVTSSRAIENPNLGRLDETITRATARGGARYSAIETTLPVSFIRGRDASAVISELIALEASGLGATVLGQRLVAGGATTALEAVLATSDSLYRVRVYLFESGTLELGVAGSIEAVASADADRFLAKLVPRD